MHICLISMNIGGGCWIQYMESLIGIPTLHIGVLSRLSAFASQPESCSQRASWETPDDGSSASAFWPGPTLADVEIWEHEPMHGNISLYLFHLKQLCILKQ